MNKKKGISAVVATVLIILITVAAVTIIWATIIPMINNQLARGTVCLDAMTALSIENKGHTCFNDVANHVQVQVKHGSKEVGLEAIQILITDTNGNTMSVTNRTLTVLPNVNEEKVLFVRPYNVIADFVSIAPVVTVGGKNETCDALAPVKLIAC